MKSVYLRLENEQERELSECATRMHIYKTTAARKIRAEGILTIKRQESLGYRK